MVIFTKKKIIKHTTYELLVYTIQKMGWPKYDVFSLVLHMLEPIRGSTIHTAYEYLKLIAYSISDHVVKSPAAITPLTPSGETVLGVMF